MNQRVTSISLITIFAIFVRWCVSLHPYSGIYGIIAMLNWFTRLIVKTGYLYSGTVSLIATGAGKPPMFDDFEAQRHWMEITYHLPIKDWYENTTDNDLMYWGLDYPPLTAYHSWLLGAIQQRINSSWIELHSSRGHESYAHKLFMRYSVLVADLLVYIPAILFYFLRSKNSKNLSSQASVALIALLYPGLILIDYGHFQYNCVSLGLTVWSINFLGAGHDLIGSATFVLALNYKHMELYHVVPFFCYLFGKCIYGKNHPSHFSRLLKLIKLATVVVITFVLCWLPFLHSWDSFVQVVHRLFPFARGLFEDKVANVWCSLSVLIKLKQIFETATLLKLCLAATVLAMLPSSIDLIRRPTMTRFKYSLVNCSLAFFLFSYQVHEKSILLPAMSVCLLLSDQLMVSVWFLVVSTFSMLPLLMKDNLTIAYLASIALFYLMADVATDTKGWRDLMAHDGSAVDRDSKTSGLYSTTLSGWGSADIIPSALFKISVAGMFVLTVILLTVNPPSRLPDLFTVIQSMYSCLHFVLFLVYFNVKQFKCDEASLQTRTKKLKSN